MYPGYNVRRHSPSFDPSQERECRCRARCWRFRRHHGAPTDREHLVDTPTYPCTYIIGKPHTKFAEPPGLADTDTHTPTHPPPTTLCRCVRIHNNGSRCAAFAVKERIAFGVYLYWDFLARPREEATDRVTGVRKLLSSRVYYPPLLQHRRGGTGGERRIRFARTLLYIR